MDDTREQTVPCPNCKSPRHVPRTPVRCGAKGNNSRKGDHSGRRICLKCGFIFYIDYLDPVERRM